MADQLKIYNMALLMIGQNPLSALTDTNENRRILDQIWNNDPPATDSWLEQGFWNFAMRTRKAAYDPDYDPDYGFKYVYQIPSDLVRMNQMSANEYFRGPQIDFKEEGGFWFCDYQEIYLRYVSNDNSYGGNLSLWPASFTKFCESDLAFMAAHRIDSGQLDRLYGIRRKALTDARSKDAMREPTGQQYHGSWVQARVSGNGSAWDRGSRGSLTG